MLRRVLSAVALLPLFGLPACGDESSPPDDPHDDTAAPERCVDGAESGGRVCIDGSFVSCSTVGSTHCQACGCGYRTSCDQASGRCEPILARLHEPCDDHADCTSNNCGVPAAGLTVKVCLVEIGAPCTAETCGICRSDGVHSLCSRDCSDDAEPAQLTVSTGKFYCLVHTITHEAVYRPACSDEPKRCALSTESCWTGPVGTPAYCDAKPGSAGAYCADHSACDAPLICNSWNRACAAPKPNGTSCDDGTECTSGLCDNVCVAGLSDGRMCDDPSDCESNRCEDSRCRAALLDLGATCREDADCASSACDQVCRQRDPEEACVSPVECASGLCLERCARAASVSGAERCTSLTCSSGYCTDQCYQAELERGEPCTHSEQCADEGAEVSACVDDVCERAREYNEACRWDRECISGLCASDYRCL